MVVSHALSGNTWSLYGHFFIVCAVCSQFKFSLFDFLAGSPFFRDDTRLRALRFLDHMLVIVSISALLMSSSEVLSKAVAYDERIVETENLLIHH